MSTAVLRCAVLACVACVVLAQSAAQYLTYDQLGGQPYTVRDTARLFFLE